MSSSLTYREFLRAAKRRRLALIVLSLLLCALFLPRVSQGMLQSSEEQSVKPKHHKAEFVSGEILVRFRSDTATSTKDNASAMMTVREDWREIPMRVERFDGSEMVEGLRLVRVQPEDTLEAIRALKAQPDVLYAEPNYLRHACKTPNDPRFSEMWALKNTGQSGGIVGADIKAEQAWDQTTGSRDVVVAVIDEGIDVNHPDLRENIWRNPGEIPGNGIDDDGNGFVDDYNGYDFLNNDSSVFDGSTDTTNQTDAHGTHVAGTIGAVGNNGVGVVGVNWQVSLMSLKFLGRDGGTSANAIRAYSYVKMMRDLWVSSGGRRGANIRVTNNSYGDYGRSQAELEAIRAMGESGILFVAAAGNDFNSNEENPSYPASYDAPNVISVTAIDRLGEFWFGEANYGANSVHMGAPGVQILSTKPNGTYGLLSGTSMASPHVAGAAALLCSAYPSISVSRLRTALLYSGDEVSSLASRTITGRRLNASNALQNVAEIDTTPPSSVSNFHITSQSGRFVTLEWIAPGDDGNTGRASQYELRYSDTDLSSAAQFDQAIAAVTVIVPRPEMAGTTQSITVRVPYQHTAGFFGIRAIDNVGNKSGIAVVKVSVDASVADPYIVTQSGASALSNGGAPLSLRGDDVYAGYQLPFDVPFFGFNVRNVTVSSNGALYFSLPPDFQRIPRLNNGDSLDGESSIAGLNQRTMIAGLWDDLRTDKRPGDDVYIITSDPTRVIFRWQAVTFDTPLVGGGTRGENPVNFEIELRRDGTIQIRYGDGNQKLLPVVGLSGGPDAYLISSHTSESVLKDLTNAPTVTFALRNPPPPPASDMEINVRDTPDPVFTGQLLTYDLVVTNRGPIEAYNINITDPLPAGTTFVSCASFGNTCTGPAAGANGTVSARVNYLGNGSSATVSITARVTAPPGTTLSNTASVTSLWRDPNTANNSSTATTQVIPETYFSDVKAIGVGIAHTLAAKTDGTVWAWGSDGSGQLGSGTIEGRITPLQVSGLTNPMALDGGEDYSLALKSDGTVWAWGSNRYGQLGNGISNGNGSATPTQVISLTNITAIAAGGSHGVALRNDGTVWVWGYNFAGQLGNGTTSIFANPTPAQVRGLANIIAISAGRSHTVALRNDGTVWAWGANYSGQIGIATTTREVTTPTQLNGFTNMVAVGAGEGHTIALRSDGIVLGIGSGRSGQLGNNRPADSLTPVQANITGVTAIAAGSSHTVAVKLDGTVWAWGANDAGQLGDGTSGAGKSFPVQVSGLSNVRTIAAHYNHTAALLNDGTIRAWGLNANGQLGDNTQINRSLPVQVSGLGSVSMPIFSPDSSSNIYNSPITVTVWCITDGAIIHYTINGAQPTENDPVIATGDSMVLSTYTNLKAKAFKNGWASSSVKDATYSFYYNPSTSKLQFSAASYNASEGAGSASITVTRTGDTSLPATVRYTTVDDTAPVRCDVTNGTAYARCDYATAVDTLQFAPGETQKTFTIPLIDDAFTEGPETVSISLSNPVGATLGNQSTATLTIQDNDSTAGANPIFATPAFVRQQYLDFLSREPEAAGFDAWAGVLNRCSDVNNDPSCDRIAVSASFFQSQEFQLKGYFVYRFYQASLGRLPRYTEIIPDMRSVTGQTGDEVVAKKAAFTNEWVQRPEFKAIYGAFIEPASFVDRLLQTAGVTLTGTVTRDSLISDLRNGTKTRADVVRAIVDSAEVDRQEYNGAFVAMQYFGYLRRDPEPEGYEAWLRVINRNPQDYRTMVNGFMNSTEYRLRFGQTQ